MLTVLLFNQICALRRKFGNTCPARSWGRGSRNFRPRSGWGGETRNFLADFALFSGKVKWERREGSNSIWLTMVRSRDPAPAKTAEFPGSFEAEKLQCKGYGRVGQNQRFWAPWRYSLCIVISALEKAQIFLGRTFGPARIRLTRSLLDIWPKVSNLRQFGANLVQKSG